MTSEFNPFNPQDWADQASAIFGTEGSEQSEDRIPRVRVIDPEEEARQKSITRGKRLVAAGAGGLAGIFGIPPVVEAVSRAVSSSAELASRFVQTAPDAFARFVYHVPGTAVTWEGIGLIDAANYVSGRIVNFHSMANGVAGVGALVALEHFTHLPSRAFGAGLRAAGQGMVGVFNALSTPPKQKE